jgi:predicted AlkP superfamily pyrophosphatase or phosphodiesterase
LPKNTERAILVPHSWIQRYSEGIHLSTKAFQRVFWVVLDGMGYELARRCISTGRFPALSRIQGQGHLGPARPASPVCQTPPALLTLFTGEEPAQSGVWGYYMPDPKRREASVSGFHAKPRHVSTLWDVLEKRGQGYALMNVAYRNDPVWSLRGSHLQFGYDGYRLWQKPAVFRLDRRGRGIHYRGIALTLAPSADGVVILKGSRVRGRLAEGEGKVVQLTQGLRAFVHLLDRSVLIIHPLIKAVCRGSIPGTVAADGFLDTNVFRMVRRLNERRPADALLPVAAEMMPSALCMAQKAELMSAAITNERSRLVVGYFPLIDELNHAYFDLLETEWPDGRVSELYCASVALVDQLLERVMHAAGQDTLVVVSSDHGAASSRKLLHLNELLAAEGIVKRSGDAYDLTRSAAFYHPSDCGQVVAGRNADRAAILAPLRRALERAHHEFGIDIGMQEGSSDDPYVAFLFPLGDGYFTGNPPGRGRSVLDSGRRGGHHLSPLSPTPWIQAMLGLWSPRSAALANELPAIPADNKDVKKFILEVMGEM